MLSINLIPKKLKNEIRLQKISRSIDKMLFVFGFFLLFFLASFYLTSFYLQNHLVHFKTIASDATKNTESYTTELASINKTTQFIKGIQEKHTKWSSFLAILGNDINNGVSVNSITIDKEKNSITISAHANTRDNLLVFKENIEKNPFLGEIVFPIKTLFEKEDIDFSINAIITKYEFSEL